METKKQVHLVIDGVKHVIEGIQADVINEYASRKAKAMEIAEEKKARDKKVKESEQAFYDLLTDNQLRFNEETDIQLFDTTGSQLMDTFKVSNKEIEPPKLIDKKGLVSILADGVNDGFITVSKEILTYLIENEYSPGLDFSEIDEELTSVQFDKLLKTTKTKEINKEKIKIK